MRRQVRKIICAFVCKVALHKVCIRLSVCIGLSDSIEISATSGNNATSATVFDNFERPADARNMSLGRSVISASYDTADRSIDGCVVGHVVYDRYQKK